MGRGVSKYPKGGGAARGARSAGVRWGFQFGKAMKTGRRSSIKAWASISRMTQREYRRPPEQRITVARYQKGNGKKYREGFKFGMKEGRR